VDDRDLREKSETQMIEYGTRMRRERDELQGRIEAAKAVCRGASVNPLNPVQGRLAQRLLSVLEGEE
jgi:hypothetical protein